MKNFNLSPSESFYKNSHSAIELKNLSTGYTHSGKKFFVSKEVSATLRRGELTALLGPNGAGKSTLMRTLCGFLPPLDGEILINGISPEKLSPLQMAREVAVVLTDRPSMENMTVRETVALGRSPYTGFFGRYSVDDYRIVDEELINVGISHLANRKIASLSDGELQKTMITKALVQQTGIIILDEPTAFLDFPSKMDIFQLLRNLAKNRNKGILLSTHDMEAILQVADSLWLLDKERGLITGTTENLSYNGSIADYFQHPGLSFNPSTRHFILE